jgi:hypothetical protein
VKADEVEPAQIAVEVAGGETASRAKEILGAGMAGVDGLDVEFATDTLTDQLVEPLVTDAQSGRARRTAVVAVGRVKEARPPVAVHGVNRRIILGRRY